jgi:hypothetical protein
MSDSFFRTGDFFAESGVKRIEGYRLPRRYYSLINTVAWGFIILVPMVYYLLRLLTSGSTIYFSVGIGIIGICKYAFSLLHESSLPESLLYTVLSLLEREMSLFRCDWRRRDWVILVGIFHRN